MSGNKIKPKNPLRTRWFSSAPEPCQKEFKQNSFTEMINNDDSTKFTEEDVKFNKLDWNFSFFVKPRIRNVAFWNHTEGEWTRSLPSSNHTAKRTRETMGGNEYEHQCHSILFSVAKGGNEFLFFGTKHFEICLFFFIFWPKRFLRMRFRAMLIGLTILFIFRFYYFS